MNLHQKIWDSLLQLKAQLDSNHQIVGWSYYSGVFKCHKSMSSLLATTSSAILINSTIQSNLLQKGWQVMDLPFDNLKLFFDTDLSEDVIKMLQLYWPLSIASFHRKERPFVIVHVAASLDGRMATSTGDSKWIGNKENLIHAHRLRALVDGVLVGAGTVKQDHPSLNVRHVCGGNPTRLVISNQTADFSSLQQIENTKTILLREDRCAFEDTGQQFDEIIFYSGNDNHERFADLFKKLCDQGIRSLLVEGGSKTVSGIFNAGGIDVFQIHYAPIILGSGKSIVVQPLIDKIADASSLKNAFWTKMGDAYMITAAL